MVSRSRLLLAAANNASNAAKQHAKQQTAASATAAASSSPASSGTNTISSPSSDSTTPPTGIVNHANGSFSIGDKIQSKDNGSAACTEPMKFLHHHHYPHLFPDRSYGSVPYYFHTLSSATKAAMSLLSDQEARDEFMKLTSWYMDSNGNNNNNSNDAIINTTVLGQSELGFLHILSLYHELSSPIFRQHDFQPKEFLGGCGWALERFHETKEDWLRLLASERTGETNGGSDGNVEDSHGKVNVVGASEASADNAETDKKGQLTSSPVTDTNEAPITSSSSSSVISEKEEELFKMITPNHLASLASELEKRILLHSASSLLFQANSKEQQFKTTDSQQPSYLIPIEGSAKVKHVALLSARVDEIQLDTNTPPNQEFDKSDAVGNNDDKNNDPDAPLEDDTLKYAPHTQEDEQQQRNRNEQQDNVQVVVQLQVLYDLEQKFISSSSSSSSSSIPSLVMVNPHDNIITNKDKNSTEGGSNNTNQKEFVISNVSVGTFEGCLHYGNPPSYEQTTKEDEGGTSAKGNTNEAIETGLRWRIDSIRPAYEFGSAIGGARTIL